MDMRRIVGMNVRALRIAKGQTQDDLAHRCGLSQQYLSALERGKRNPTVITLYEIAVGLEVAVHTLLLESD